jgi:flagellar basal-body rod modification protein FlgD
MYTPPVQGTASSHQLASKKSSLNPDDFIKMMITQLQNQDPMEPAKNDQLLAQMSQIGQLQSSTQLQDSLKGLVLQNQIGSAATLIGKTVQGMDTNNNTIAGVVSSVRVQDDGVSLELDNGQSLQLGRVTAIAPTQTTTTGAPAPGPTAAKPA